MNAQALHDRWFRKSGVPVVVFRCTNTACSCKTFTHLLPVPGVEEVVGRSRYTASSKKYASHKLLRGGQSYNSLVQELKGDFNCHTSISTLHSSEFYGKP